MIKSIATGLLILFFVASPAYAQSYSPSGSHSHYVHPYCSKNGKCVRGHMAGNPGSGEHWHLNKNGSDTVHHPNGAQETIPNIAPSK